MATITLRSVKGAPLTNDEVDGNFANLNLALTTDANITGGNIIGVANIASAGNVFGNYFLGNGSLLSGISVDSTRILSANSAVVIVEPDGSISLNVNSNPVITVSTSNVELLGNVRVTGALKDNSGNVLVIKDSGGNVIWGS